MHFDELPEAVREDAFMGLISGDGGGKPLETLNFLKSHKRARRYERFQKPRRPRPMGRL